MTDKKKLWEQIAPYKNILIFTITLLVSNYLWKLTVVGDENGGPVSWLGIVDITAPFAYMAEHITDAVYSLLTLCRDTVYRVNSYTFRFVSGSGTRVVWGCTPIKQSFIWLCLMLTATGSWRKKIWYIPAGWVIIYGFNILRIFLIALLTEYHPERFELYHTYLFKYLFYGIIFAMWWVFVELVSARANPPKK